VWQKTVTERDAEGVERQIVHRYTELADGLHYWDKDQQDWLESKEEIEIVNGVGLALRGQQRVIFSANVNDPQGAIDLSAGDGGDAVRLRSSILALIYFDAASGKSVTIATAKDTAGEVIPPNQVIYRDAFDHLQADVLYTYRRTGLEQDVILREQPADPDALGLLREATRLEVLTEFFEAPQPQKRQTILDRVDDPALRAAMAAPDWIDEELDFGPFRIAQGRAFLLGAGPEADEAVVVGKEWFTTPDQRTLLSESVDFLSLLPQLEQLPVPGDKPGAGLRRRADTQVAKATQPVPLSRRLKETMLEANAAARVAERRARSLPRRLVASTAPPVRGEIVLAKAPKTQTPGLVLDYTTLNGTYNDYLFKGDTTYFVSGQVTLGGAKTTFEGGTVVKYTNLTTAKLTLNAPIVWQGTAYRPVVLTARDDQSVGESITPTNALSGYYAGVALEINASTANADALLQNFRVVRAQTGIALNGRAGHVLSHAQFVDCQNGIKPSSAEFRLRNALFGNVLTNFNGTSSTGRCEQLTVNTASWFNYNSAIQLNLTNCLLVAITNLGAYSGANNQTVSSASGVFQSIGSGSHYLAAGSPYRNGGTTAINATLANTLKKLTTYPPLQLTTDFTTSTTLNPQAQRDTDTPDLGYHYDPLDYLLTSLNITNATVTLTNGVALGIYGTKGLSLRTGSSKLIGEGSPTALNRMVRYQTVQEQPVLLGSTASSMNLVELLASTPEITLRFTDLSVMAETSGRRGLAANLSTYAVNPLTLAHCQVRGIYQYIGNSTVSGTVMSWNNNTFERCTLTWSQSDSYYVPTVSLYNDLFSKGALSFTTTSTTPPWTVKDNLFDCDSLTKSGYASFSNSNNGYRNGLSPLGGGTGDKTIYTMDFQSGSATNWFGVLGNFYYPTSGTNLFSLVNAGSRSAPSAGLYHYTVRADNAKETTGTVDIGFHYVAANGSHQPNDYDGDGAPDYLEDRNGNGTFDSGETDWQTYNSSSGLSGSVKLVTFTPLKP
jgi:hypothetical protein